MFVAGDGSFGSGYIDLGEGFQVAQITTFKKIWSSYEGGPNNLGASFYEPTLLPDSFFLLGSYAQPNNQQFFGFFLVGKDNNLNNTSSGTRILEPPIDYTLIYTTEYLDINQDGPAYVWLPIPPDNYKALGYILTTTNQKPPLDKVRCVRSDFTEKCENDKWICGGTSEESESEYIVYSISPINRGTKALGVTAGTFFFQDSSSLSCLKNTFSPLSSMANLSQIQALVQTCSPFIYFHPNELYLPSSVNWFFSNGALLYQQGKNRIESNLMARTFPKEVPMMKPTG
ncbi:hypothetical protein LIER_22270 [Lithospermum erythrorhizon]|uniref:Uncharacterized protein n=1 Tax=Lithospermum erythrorhizon TaxID=34254 RepID=A0AAV3QYZ3_LITER